MTTLSEQPQLPTVSILVAAWNEAPYISACLVSLTALSWPGLEVLVSAGGDDGTYDIASRHANERLTVIPQRPGQGKQAALRELLERSIGDILYLTDGDTIVSEETFRAVLAPIVHGEVDVTTGNYRPYTADLVLPLVFYQWSIDRAVQRGHGRDSEGITGANAAVTRTALMVAGGFDADVQTGTDYVLARKLRSAGYPIRYVDAGVETEYANNPYLYARRRSRWLRNTFLHGRRLGDRTEVRNSLVTMGMGLSTLTGPLTLPVTKYWGGLAWGGLVTILLKRRIDYARALSAETQVPVPRAFGYWMPYLTMWDQIASVMALFDLLSAKRRTRW